MPPRGRGGHGWAPRTKTASELHRGWLELVDSEGPFLAVPPLKRVWPHGMPGLSAERLDALRIAKPAFDHAWEAADLDPDDEPMRVKYRQARDEWVRTVLRDVAGWQNALIWGAEEALAVVVDSPDRRVQVASQGVLRGPDGLAALVSVVDRSADLRATGSDGWAASAIDRMAEMLRQSDVRIGVVTDGQWWALVSVQPEVMVASGIVDALTWTEEPLARNAFLTLLSRQYLIGGAPDERLPVLFAESVAAAEEVTEALGTQVRAATEGLVQAFWQAAEEARRRGQDDPLPADPGETYTAAVTVMMRVVFLLFAEERGLLPAGWLFRAGYGLSDQLDVLERRVLDEGEESLDSTYLTWHRLLATSQALHRGATFEDMRMPAYGGSLFDPERFPFLIAPGESGTLALTVSDRVMLHILRSIQIAQFGAGDARRISFRDIDVEQIGYIYENLLGYTCSRVIGDIQVGLRGSAGAEPEMPLTVLEALAELHPEPAALASAIIGWLKENQPSARPPSVSTLAKLLATAPSEEAERALRAVSADDVLRDRLRRWATVTRPDLRGHPTVVPEGGLLVTETPSRRNAGAHYTPSDLAMAVVEHALEPLCYSPGPHQTPDTTRWRLRAPDEILGLKVVDIAAGSGAFLVAAARYLGARLVEAWIAEDPTNARLRGLGQRAVRQVVARCLYGADINAMAVEMCKLSLWLVSLDRNLPFSFVDDKILHGNSLLGLTSLRQLRALHIDPPENQQPRLTAVDADTAVRRVMGIRGDLASEVDEFDPQRSATAKRRLLDRQHQAIADASTIADAVIAVGLRLGGKPGSAMDEAYDDLAEAVGAAWPPDGGAGNPEALNMVIEAGLTPTVTTDYSRWKPLHWVLEVPDVLVGHGGFDAVIGNPPYLDGRKIARVAGSNFRDWIIQQLANGKTGTADLVVYFFLRAYELLRSTGTFGLLGTNSVGQGISREVGLDQLVANGVTLTRAVQSAAWPSASANLEYAAIWGSVAPVAEDAHRVADGVVVPRISSLLEAAGRIDGNPVELTENDGVAYQGCIVLGKGFLLEPDEAHSWIVADGENREVLFPYLNGEDVNSRPDLSPSRWVIDFGDRCLICSGRYPQPFARLYETVRLERAKASAVVAAANWWQFWRPRQRMREKLAEMDSILVIARVSRTVMPVRIPNASVPSDAVVIFATGSYVDQAVLSSSLHQLWAIKYGSGMRNDPRYTPSDVFDTFPRPEATTRLDQMGQALDNRRREIMLRRQLGLTKLYNLVNDPDLPDDVDQDVATMRRLHVQLDEAVAAAYDWSDVDLDHGFHTYRQATRWTVSPAARVELLDRLLAENLRRAAAQPKRTGKALTATRPRIARQRTVNENQGTLL
ncbi:Eco57I restriction-modification methylase domain-containing protein [Cryptosporangium japonicum]|uniref:site-specific DNA-methyltransferase (adenine-specific) n=1 Tax=Cryptosporangium japonicum TaxID=80872 RepID=A0ABN0UYB8_9ACTN